MNLVLAVTGASGAYAAELLLEKSPWPISLIASRWGKDVAAYECQKTFDSLAQKADVVYKDDDLWAPVSSGSVPTRGMVILPCSSSTVGAVASGLGESLIHRAAHCHLKERRPIVFCLRETPLTTIDLENCQKISAAGGIIMPLSPPFYFTAKENPKDVTMHDLLDSFVDRVLAQVGKHPDRVWEKQD